MPETDLFKEVGGGLVERLFSGVMWFGIVVILMAAVLFTMWYFFVYMRKFDIEVRIKSNRAEDKYNTIIDKAAILYEWRSKDPYIRVWGLKRDFPVPEFEILQKTSKGDLLELYRAGEEEFYFLTPSKIVRTHILKKGGVRIPIATHKQEMQDTDMAFWIETKKDANEKMLNTKNLFMKLLPYIPYIMGGMIIIFILYILMDKLPGILQSLNDLVESMNRLQAAQITTKTV
jgi:hypothetical protein